MSVRSSLITAPLSGCPLGSFTSPSSVVVWAQAEQAKRATRPAKESCCRNRAIIVILLLLPGISISGYYEFSLKTADEPRSGTVLWDTTCVSLVHFDGPQPDGPSLHRIS